VAPVDESLLTVFIISPDFAGLIKVLSTASGKYTASLAALLG
jgi:hypothetical protein